jgi:hypothetical protein
MGIIIVGQEITKNDINASREDYPEYIKITADLDKEIVAIGGEYHADAERVLVERFDSKRSDIWGGGYNISTKAFEVNAMLNLKSGSNESLEILDPKIRTKFLEIIKNKLGNIESLI